MILSRTITRIPVVIYEQLHSQNPFWHLYVNVVEPQWAGFAHQFAQINSQSESLVQSSPVTKSQQAPPEHKAPDGHYIVSISRAIDTLYGRDSYKVSTVTAVRWVCLHVFANTAANLP
jgi:hypothetical protein